MIEEKSKAVDLHTAIDNARAKIDIRALKDAENRISAARIHKPEDCASYPSPYDEIPKLDAEMHSINDEIAELHLNFKDDLPDESKVKAYEFLRQRYFTVSARRSKLMNDFLNSLKPAKEPEDCGEKPSVGRSPDTDEAKPFVLSAPWNAYVREVKCLFGKDPDIHIVYDEQVMNLRLYVSGEKKWSAIKRIMPSQKVFGKVTLGIDVIGSFPCVQSIEEVLTDAFRGNPVFDSALCVKPDGCDSAFTYLVFDNKVAQYWNDNIADPNGICSVMYPEIASDVLDLPQGVMPCVKPGEDIVK